MALTLTGGDSRQSVGISLVSLCLCLGILTGWSESNHAQQPPGQQPAAQQPAAQQPPAQPPAGQPPAGQRPATGQPPLGTDPQAKPPTRPPVGRPPATTRPPASKPKEEEVKPPTPEGTYLRTKDGWSIYCTYYGPMEGVRNGKEVVPVILLHGWEGQGAEYGRFATLLQTIGCAVMVPDLRGHGRSTSCRRPDRRTGELKDEEIKVDDLEPQDMAGMTYDVEAVKKELLIRHNKGELNIEMLCVGGADVGAIVAIGWSAMDWSWPVTPSLKQGQDVKGLILLSPRLTFKGLNATAALAHPAVDRQISVMVAVGSEDRKAYSDAKRVYSSIEKNRETYNDPAEKAKKQNCFFFEAETPLEGTRLLDPQLPVYRYVGTFLKLRFFDQAENYPWSDRTSP